ncbi:hypothetical protein PCASD_02268 [Puccinia coronata f. sp. avenae]|uniref:Uncharacterized protein n=1 Tax=Puccinia coronata f. sp. avenae TaxID=200324 RepID=A0A2N5VI04_9BASI|nr:hypothetical protein PCASD_20404 [Puccinia coronata f. sp. avenae]PLW49633.1 hypothetical protein PCASD_02268 [Puccinia coronata f. sp. avenae]
MFGGRNGSQVVPRSRAEQRHQTTEADVTIPTALGSLEHRHKSVSTSRQSIQAKSTLVIHPCLKLQETPRMNLQNWYRAVDDENQLDIRLKSLRKFL